MYDVLLTWVFILVMMVTIKGLIMLSCFDLTGRVIAVTGAGKGLGRVFAEALAKSGARLFIIGRNRERLVKASGEIKALGAECSWYQADIRDEAAVQGACDECVKIYGRVDVLVNNAGASRINKPPEETSLDEWNEVLGININGSFICARIFGAQMIKQKKGRIINLASMSGFIINKGVSGGSYETSKFAVIGLTKHLAVEWAKYNINVNALAPGYFMTEPNREFFDQEPDKLAQFVESTPMRRIGDPGELEGAIVYLASDATSFMTGSVLVVDGGFTCW
jgi:gluconate 5-dehydrogenase